MAAKPDFALAGTMPGDHGLHAIRESVLADPRARRIAIVEIVFRDGKVHRPEDGPDEHTEIMTIVELEPVTDAADQDQARAMMARARLNRTGQGRLDDDENASASAVS